MLVAKLQRRQELMEVRASDDVAESTRVHEVIEKFPARAELHAEEGDRFRSLGSLSRVGGVHVHGFQRHDVRVRDRLRVTYPHVSRTKSVTGAGRKGRWEGGSSNLTGKGGKYLHCIDLTVKHLDLARAKLGLIDALQRDLFARVDVGSELHPERGGSER